MMTASAKDRFEGGMFWVDRELQMLSWVGCGGDQSPVQVPHTHAPSRGWGPKVLQMAAA
jgi:hypothetical protein